MSEEIYTLPKKCPRCKESEVKSNHQRTFYGCGSSDYNGNKITFIQTSQCNKNIMMSNRRNQGIKRYDKHKVVMRD